MLRSPFFRRAVFALTGMLVSLRLGFAEGPGAAIDFNRQVRPILSEHCFACHGPDEKARKAKLRLDTREGAFAALRSGGHAFVAGKPDQSEAIARIVTTDPSEVMPPPKFGKKLTPEQIALLKRWVEAGAPWNEHWAFVSPRRPELPKVKNAGWPRNPIDQFILASLERAGLEPSPQADKVTRIRRVTLDLTGLPPTPAEVDAFLADTSAEAYEKVVDRLLRSPRYAEHMTRIWLDAARYGDTHGLHLDNFREMWPYRDWVLKAFATNMPFDRFIIEQLAGDLLPNPTLDQIVATGFNRCHVTTSEGGSIEEEIYVRNVVDQVDTNGMVFLGLSTGCARCHDHKYDPITMKDYYQLFAFFNSIDGGAMDGNSARHAPYQKMPTPEQEQELARHEARVGALRRAAPLVGGPGTMAATRLRVQAEQARDAFDKTIPATLIFKERAQPRPAYLLKRGEYDQRGEQVGRDTPAFLPPFPEGAPKNRLGFAQWLVTPTHPLTARVAVNRFWQQLFGTGLVKTAEDFGSQGEPPSHPELLDWLALQFLEDGWDVHKTLKRMVLSATYQQSSKVTPDRLTKDPANRLLARGPRFRLDAEALRDQALFVSGLLVERVGGPSVKPPQPAGLWEAVGYVSSNTRNFVADTGRDKVHRRSLYTFWKRTAPPPQMNSFDAPSREACTIRRERTNTPLQALLLLNETQYVECARALAERALREGGATTESRLTHLFRLAAVRLPDARELQELSSALASYRTDFARDPKGAGELIGVGESKPDPKLDPVELAAWTMIANTVLNLDEVVNKG